MGSAVLRLVGRWSYGLACPVDGLIFSAAHIGTIQLITPAGVQFLPVNYRYSDGMGRSGHLFGFRASQTADIGVFEAAGPVGKYDMAQEGVFVGDRMTWFEFALDAVEPTRRDAQVLSIVAGHAVFDRSPSFGASGGCAFNQNGEVIGIIVWQYKLKSGVAVILE